jgi:hypothetical protein
MRWIYWIFGRGKGKRGGGENEMGKKCKYIQEKRRKRGRQHGKKQLILLTSFFVSIKVLGRLVFNAEQQRI